VRDLIVAALATPGAGRTRALAALGGRDDGAALAPLVPAGAEPLAPATAAAVAEVAAGARDAVAALLDDADPEARASALRILAKAGDGRVSAARVVKAAAGPAPMRESALFVARRWATARVPALPRSPRASPPRWRRDHDVVTRVVADAPRARHGARDRGRRRRRGARRSLDDPSPIVRAAAADGLATPRGPRQRWSRPPRSAAGVRAPWPARCKDAPAARRAAPSTAWPATPRRWSVARPRRRPPRHPRVRPKPLEATHA